MKVTNSKLQVERQRGQLTIQILILGFVTMVILGGFVIWSDTYVKSVSHERERSQAFTIAEAGMPGYATTTW